MTFKEPKQSEQQEKSPIIELPDNQELRIMLENKLAEYKERLNKFIEKDPYLVPESYELSDTNHKIVVLEELLEKGRINTWDLSRELAKRPDFYLDAGRFNNACAVIEDYIKTGGKRNRGGTGLK